MRHRRGTHFALDRALAQETQRDIAPDVAAHVDADDIDGRDRVAGIPKTIVVDSEEVREALAEPINAIVDAVRIVLERAPPELCADIVDKATDILERMLDDLVAIPVDNEDDATRVEFFAENYRIVLADRRRYTASLRRFELVPYSETVVGGGPVTNVVLDFTAGVKGNDVPECSPPGELGGDVQV